MLSPEGKCGRAERRFEPDLLDPQVVGGEGHRGGLGLHLTSLRRRRRESFRV